jgi:Flp pilus assembly pilin Flp
MIKKIHSFIKDEDGAVTVDWVVLTAAIIFIAISAFAFIQQSSGAMSASVGTFLIDTDQNLLRNPN